VRLLILPLERSNALSRECFSCCHYPYLDELEDEVDDDVVELDDVLTDFVLLLLDVEDDDVDDVDAVDRLVEVLVDTDLEDELETDLDVELLWLLVGEYPSWLTLEVLLLL
jgi:hypothetical protein